MYYYHDTTHAVRRLVVSLVAIGVLILAFIMLLVISQYSTDACWPATAAFAIAQLIASIFLLLAAIRPDVSPEVLKWITLLAIVPFVFIIILSWQLAGGSCVEPLLTWIIVSLIVSIVEFIALTSVFASFYCCNDEQRERRRQEDAEERLRQEEAEEERRRRSYSTKRMQFL